MSATAVEGAPAAAAAAKAAVLAEALPWLGALRGATVVVKYGGHAMCEEPLRRAFAEDVVLLRHAGARPVVVHGGGPQVSAHLERLGVPTRFVAGLRVTTEETVAALRTVLVGEVQRELVGLLNAHGPLAVGLSGEDALLLTAARRGALVDGEEVDVGLVGDVVAVRPAVLHGLLEAGCIPVVTGLAPGADGGTYNVNADTAAAAVAVALGARRLWVLTDVAGLYADWPQCTELVASLTADELEARLPGLSTGMLPKMEACLRAVRGGVPVARVLDGRVPHALLLDAFPGPGSGTRVLP